MKYFVLNILLVTFSALIFNKGLLKNNVVHIVYISSKGYADTSTVYISTARHFYKKGSIYAIFMVQHFTVICR
jgi:hypothetical protein